jgi:hypothetical protein
LSERYDERYEKYFCETGERRREEKEWLGGYM